MNTREIKCPFGLINIGGLIKTKPIKELNKVVGAEAICPLFCHESYKLKTTFNRKLDPSFSIMESKDENDDGKHY